MKQMYFLVHNIHVCVVLTRGQPEQLLICFFSIWDNNSDNILYVSPASTVSVW
jgi:hypothetical protein